MPVEFRRTGTSGDNAISMTTPDVQAAIERGCVAADNGDWTLAREEFALAAEAGDAVAQYNLGNALRNLGRRAEAEAAFVRAAALGVEEAWLNLGLLQEERGARDEATAAFGAGAAAGDSNATRALARLLLGDGRVVEAECLYRSLMPTTDPDVVVDLALLLLRSGRVDEAERVLADVDALSPTDEMELAKAWRHIGATEVARQRLQGLVDAGVIAALVPLANLLWDDLGELESAEALLRRAAGTGDVHALTNLGLLLHQLGRPAEAIRVLRTAAAQGDVLAQRALRPDESEA